MTFSLQYKGFDYVAFFNGAYEDSDSLPSLVQTGANSIEVTLDYGIDVTTSQVVADANYTDSLAALGNTIDQAEGLGLSVMVRPLIDFLNPAVIAPYSVGDWRQTYQPTNVATFFASYQQMIIAEAKVAQQNGAQMLSIGAELDQLAGAQYLPYWTNIINAVHAVFSGKLTYSASWNTASNVSFWSQLDYEGVDCYVPLSNAQNPTIQDLVNGWIDPATQSTNPGAYAAIGNQSPIQYFESLAAQSGKPLLFTELGYANDSGAAANPSASGNSPDPTLQADLYQAFFKAWAQSGSSSLVGTYFWEWDPNGSTSNVGPGIDSFSPQNSPAQNAATAGFTLNEPPTLANVASNVRFVPNANANVTVSPSLEVFDPHSSTLANATASITGGKFADDGDVLAANTAGTSITASYNSTTETLALSGTDTVAHYQAVLDSVTFSSGGSPTNSGANPSRTMIWVVNDGSGSNNLSVPATTTISIGPMVRNDLNADGKSDLLFQNTDGTPQIWLMNGMSVASMVTLPSPGSAWHVAATGEFNHDGNTDTLVQNTDGTPQIWLMNGTSVVSEVTLPQPPSSWHVIATGDFNADGNTDILWQNTDGTPAIWEMNGTSIISAIALPQPPSSWHVIGAGDFNGDGEADILWQNTDGTPAIWEMNGTSVVSVAALSNPGPKWQLKDDGPIVPDGMVGATGAQSQPVPFTSSPNDVVSSVNGGPGSGPATQQPVPFMSSPNDMVLGGNGGQGSGPSWAYRGESPWGPTGNTMPGTATGGVLGALTDPAKMVHIVLGG